MGNNHKSYKQIIVTLEVDDVCTESELKVLADDIAEVIEKNSNDHISDPTIRINW
jgi:hypothetical protein